MVNKKVSKQDAKTLSEARSKRDTRRSPNFWLFTATFFLIVALLVLFYNAYFTGYHANKINRELRELGFNRPIDFPKGVIAYASMGAGERTWRETENDRGDKFGISPYGYEQVSAGQLELNYSTKDYRSLIKATSLMDKITDKPVFGLTSKVWLRARGLKESECVQKRYGVAGKSWYKLCRKDGMYKLHFSYEENEED